MNDIEVKMVPFMGAELMAVRDADGHNGISVES